MGKLLDGLWWAEMVPFFFLSSSNSNTVPQLTHGWETVKREGYENRGDGWILISTSEGEIV